MCCLPCDRYPLDASPPMGTWPRWPEVRAPGGRSVPSCETVNRQASRAIGWSVQAADSAATVTHYASDNYCKQRASLWDTVRYANLPTSAGPRASARQQHSAYFGWLWLVLDRLDADKRTCPKIVRRIRWPFAEDVARPLMRTPSEPPAF